jgi:hypothetical protein
MAIWLIIVWLLGFILFWLGTETKWRGPYLLGLVFMTWTTAWALGWFFITSF